MIRSGYHMGLHSIPPAYKSKFRFAVIRNPWDWYVSQYEYARQKRYPHCQLHPKHYLPAFKTHLEKCSGSFADALPYLIEGNQSLHWALREQTDASVCMLRFENLRNELSDLFKTVTPTSLQRLQPFLQFNQRILESEKKNATSKFGTYAEYYTPALRDLVEEKEHRVIQRFGYEF